jgi:hypothetical protein
VVLFGEASEVDVAAYYMQAAGLSIGKDIAVSLVKRSRGGFRTIVNEANELARIHAMKKKRALPARITGVFCPGRPAWIRQKTYRPRRALTGS